MANRLAGVARRAQRAVGKGRGVLQDFVLEGKTPWASPHPASFKQWTFRGQSGREAGYPQVWRQHPALPFENPTRVAVTVHVFYPELVDELIDAIARIPVPVDVIVTNASEEELSDEAFRVGNVNNVAILRVENRGRDIFPLVQLVNFGLLDPYILILKLHTKRSEWREQHSSLDGDGESWRQSFIEDLAGSPEQVERVLDQFAKDTSLGCLTAPGNVLGAEFWGGDKYLTEELARRLELEIDPKTLEFAAGSMYWIRGFLLQGLSGLQLTAADFEEESGQVDATTAHAIERLLGILTKESGLSIRDTDALEAQPGEAPEDWRRFDPATELHASARFIPFYLPQFHPSPENDKWWGTGFTEWTNVSNGLPVYRGHAQPFLPGELGFYDLRFDDVRDRQYDLARAAGVEGFMYYYYWFAGKRLLHLPIEKLASQDGLSQPFCLMWANENWTRAWDGRDRDVLIAQDYEAVPAEDFINDIAEFLLDERYMRVDGKCLLAVYRPGQMPNFAAVVEEWRARAREMGIGELFVLSVDVASEFDGLGADVKRFGLDGRLGFPPHALPWKPAPAHKVGLDRRFKGNLVSYQRTANAGIEAALLEPSDKYPGVMVGFDNTARRQWSSDIWWGSNPYTYHRWLREASRAVGPRPCQQRLVFINAWNEWAESAVLEPTQRWGADFLLATRNVAFS